MIAGLKTFAEFFAGIGLVRAGLEPSGWECVFANDIDPKKREMYCGAFGADHFVCDDVWNLEKIAPAIPENLMMATASFPCTDLSLAGHWRGIDGKHSSSFFGFTEAIRTRGDRRPAIVLIENVVGLLTSHGGSDFARTAQELAGLGYWLDAFVLDARAFVPQSRPRVFIVGVQKHLKDAPVFTVPTFNFRGLFNGEPAPVPARSAVRPNPLQALREKVTLHTGWLTANLPPLPTATSSLQDLLDGTDENEWWPPDLVSKHLAPMQIPSRDRLSKLVDSATVMLGTAFRRTRLGQSRTEVRFDVAGCLRTPKGGSARQIVVRVGRGKIDMRWMTAREYARLQGAGDFPIRVPERQALFGFGDAVCVPVVKWLDQNLLSPLAELAISTTVRPKATLIAV